MLASTIDPEFNSPMGKELHGPLDDSCNQDVQDMWADINFALLYKNLNMGDNEQTHPWDPIIQSTETVRFQHDRSSIDYHRPRDPIVHRGQGEFSANVQLDTNFPGHEDIVKHLVIMRPAESSGDQNDEFKMERTPKVVAG